MVLGAPFEPIGWSLWSHPPWWACTPGPVGRADGGAVLGYSPCGSPKCTAAGLRSTGFIGCRGPRDQRHPVVRVSSDAPLRHRQLPVGLRLLDEFVGVVKAVIRDLAPHVAVIDLTHEILHDIRAGSLALARASSTSRPASCWPSSTPASGRGAGAGGRDRRGAASSSPGQRTDRACDRHGGRPGCGGRAHQHRVPPGRTGGHVRRGVTCSPPWPHSSATGSRWPRLGEAIDPAELVPGVIPVRQETTRSWPRCSGSTTSGTRSSTSGRRMWPVGTASPSAGGRGQDGHRRHHLRRDRAGRHRARARLLRPARGVVDAAVGGRRARVGSRGGDPAVAGRRGRSSGPDAA